MGNLSYTQSRGLFTNRSKNKDNEGSLISEELPVRTYVMATNIYLELNHNELHYETLIRDTSTLKGFIAKIFKAQKTVRKDR